jgi:hypothetical protein
MHRKEKIMKTREELLTEIAEIEERIANASGGAAVSVMSERLAYARQELKMCDIPVPKFGIGDRVFFAITNRDVERLPCPDCLSTQKWKVVLPTGQEFETSCQRCGGGYRSSNMPPAPIQILSRPRVESLTVGKIDISTSRSFEGDSLVKYMCTETGIGSGSVYNEAKLYATEEEAQAAGEIEAARQTAEARKEPDQQKIKRISEFTVDNAVMELAWTARWDAWYAYRRLCEEVEDNIKHGGNAQTLKEIIDWESNHREVPDIEEAMKELRAFSETYDWLRPIVEKIDAPLIAMKAAAYKALDIEVSNVVE